MGGSRLREPYRRPESGPAFYLGTSRFICPKPTGTWVPKLLCLQSLLDVALSSAMCF